MRFSLKLSTDSGTGTLRIASPKSHPSEDLQGLSSAESDQSSSACLASSALLEDEVDVDRTASGHSVGEHHVIHLQKEGFDWNSSGSYVEDASVTDPVTPNGTSDQHEDLGVTAMTEDGAHDVGDQDGTHFERAAGDGGAQSIDDSFALVAEGHSEDGWWSPQPHYESASGFIEIPSSTPEQDCKSSHGGAFTAS